MNKKGFTLMELLLVVAIIAILAAATAPTFTGGANDSFQESKKANFFNAYQQAVSGANLMMGIMVAEFTRTGNSGSGSTNEFLPAKLTLDAGNQWKIKINGKDEQRNLNFYSPVTSRVFYSLKGKQYFISAKIGDKQDVVFYWVDANGYNKWGEKKGLVNYTELADSQSGKYRDNSAQEIRLSSSNTLDDIWNNLKDTE